jgi:hypothetical protein
MLLTRHRSTEALLLYTSFIAVVFCRVLKRGLSSIATGAPNAFQSASSGGSGCCTSRMWANYLMMILFMCESSHAVLAQSMMARGHLRGFDMRLEANASARSLLQSTVRTCDCVYTQSPL